jgi:hypothetical protein
MKAIVIHGGEYKYIATGIKRRRPSLFKYTAINMQSIQIAHGHPMA